MPPVDPMAVQLTPEECVFMGSLEKSREETDKAAILAVLTDEGQAAADIAEAIKLSPTTVRRRLEGLFELGLVSRTGDGVKGSAFMYSKIRFNHNNPLRVESNSNGHGNGRPIVEAAMEIFSGRRT